MPDQIITPDDPHGFLQGVAGWSSYLPLLLKALQFTRPGPILELGMGDDSTRRLNAYVKETDRRLVSYDSKSEWVARFADLACSAHGMMQARNWDDVPIVPSFPTIGNRNQFRWSVILIDHAPGERRWFDLLRFCAAADVVIVHDTEKPGGGDYQYEKAWPSYRYRINDNRFFPGACATAVSNFIDVSKWTDALAWEINRGQAAPAV